MEKFLISKECVIGILNSLPKGNGVYTKDFLVEEVNIRLEDQTINAWEQVVNPILKDSVGVHILVHKIYQDNELTYFREKNNQLPKFNYQVKLHGYDGLKLKIIFWSEVEFESEELVELLPEIVDWSLAV